MPAWALYVGLVVMWSSGFIGAELGTRAAIAISLTGVLVATVQATNRRAVHGKVMT